MSLESFNVPSQPGHGNPYLRTFSRVVGADNPPLWNDVGAIGLDNNFHIILYFWKDFEENVKFM